jgi:hypothetical protein
MKVVVLSSSSKGNSTYIELNNVKFLIDAGLGFNDIKDKLYEILSAEDQKLSVTYRSALNRKLAYLYRFASVDTEYNDVIYALQEQLLLIDIGW